MATAKPKTTKIEAPTLEEVVIAEAVEETLIEDVIEEVVEAVIEELPVEEPVAVESSETLLEAPVSDYNDNEVESTTEIIIPNPFSPQTFITVPRAGGFVGDKRASYADQTGQIRSTRSY